MANARIKSWQDEMSRGLKRSREDDLFEEFGLSTEVPSSPASSRSSSRRRIRRKRSKRADLSSAEVELTQRFNKLKYLGQTESYRALDRELRHAEPCSTFRAWVEDNPGLFSDIDFAQWTMVEANSVVELNHLERFSRDYPLPPEADTPALAAAISYVAELLKLDEQIPFPSREDLDDVRFIGSKFPGVEYAWRGYKDRSGAHSEALDDARAAWDQLLAGERVEPHYNRIGGRGKMVTRKKIKEQGDKTTAGRLIFMTSHRDLLLNGVLEQRLTNAYKDPHFPISVGKTWWHGGTEEFLARFGGRDMYSCFDAAKYDSSLPPWLIKVAVNILRQQFVDGGDPVYDAYWRFIEDGLIYAPVYLDNGMLFQRSGGSTSGHSFNTLMQSICTLIIAYTCYLTLEGHENVERVAREVWCESLGDDQHTGASGLCARWKIEDTAPIAMRIFGVDWSGDKSFNTRRLVDDREGDFQGTQYLGKFFRWFDEDVEGVPIQANLPYRPFVETALRLYYPERGEQGILPAWQRAIGHYADGAGNTRTRAMLEAYLDWLEPQVGEGEFVWSEKWLRRFERAGEEFQAPVPPRRIGFSAWLALVITDRDPFS
uniref:RNA-dependent RNA polymerase n=1 Tax=Sclerotium rolfsii unassigned dsRNA virus 2 TaxID=2490827 RepID=A0A3G8EWE5_9VIRU|nr:RNA-dependent RNA polymerase [Sclerotium rolfsii unassigned dsRNA virus 2]